MANDEEPQDEREGAPRRRDREATSKALLEAAMQVFAERGYDAATTREIAGRAGTNEQLIQRYFGGKSGLLLAAVERYTREEREGSCALPPLADSLEAEIIGFLDFQLRHSWRCRTFTKVVLDRALVDPAVAAEMGRTVSENRIPVLRERLRTFRDRGEIDPGLDLDAVAAGLATLGFGLGFLDQVVFGQDPQRVCAVIRTLAKVFAGGLVGRSG